MEREIDSIVEALRDLNAEIVDYVVSASAPAAGRQLAELPLPGGAIVARGSRNGQLIPPKGGTRLEPGDHLFVIARTSDRSAVDDVFAAST